ncbi:MAG: co-chaperone GroES [Clostridia bacterium]|nr:co-chaperone GroES [Clostridia bacterium]
MKIQPLFDRVVLERIKEEQPKSIAGLVLPMPSEEQPLLAKVIAVGNGFNSEGKQTEMQVEIGDTILYSKYAGSIFKFENKEVVIIRQNDILAKIIEKK